MRVMRSAGSVFAVAGLGLCLALPVLAGPAPEPPALRLPSTAEPTGYAVDLTIDPALETFRGVVDIEIRVREKTSLLWLNASDLAIAKVSANAGGRAVGVRAVPGGENFAGFAFDKPLAPGGVKLHVEYTGKVDANSTQGIFRQKDAADWYVFTQFETTDARRAFPCFDEPSFKVRWQLTLRIPSGTTALSNTPIEFESAGADGARVVRFQKTDAAAELPDRVRGRPVRIPRRRARPARRRRRSASSRRAARRRRAATRRRRRGRCSSASRRTSAFRTRTRSSTSSRSRRPSRSRPWRTPA